jgi:cytochrome P450
MLVDSCYERAEEFLPERWGERPELVHNKGVFVPFSSGKSVARKIDAADEFRGTYSCIGKQLALMELRNVTARIVSHFDIAFAPGEDGKNLLEKTKDVFTLEVAPLKMIFTTRNK